MNLTKEQLWKRFQKYYTEFPALGLAVDLSRLNHPDEYFAPMEAPMRNALAEMAALEKGAIANADEQRMVGHYWLRTPALAPTPEIRRDIEETVAAVKRFTQEIHGGVIQGEKGIFMNLLLIGIGGSALGPQLVSSALGHPARDKMKVYFFDNTDPDGMDRVLAGLTPELGQTLCLIISKSGGTKETRNGMLEAKAAYERAGLSFVKHAVGITGKNSELDKYAAKEGWICRFPMWDWVGGRTSETSVVGLLPAALQGIDINGILAGASACDQITRNSNVIENPSALLALAWHQIGNGIGSKDMVILPYKDRLELFSKYLQQLIMESLGKELDRKDNLVNQGIAVYGNKGSTDQHAYVQQLREGVANFFVTFIEVLKDRDTLSMEVEPHVTSGDYLSGFFLGTREALFDNGRQSITLTINELSPFSLGVLIALFERAVGFYASLVNINAYHQPGVEAGKRAAGKVIDLQTKIMDYLRKNPGKEFSVEQIAQAINTPDSETIFKICEHLTANKDRGVAKTDGKAPGASRYRLTH